MKTEAAFLASIVASPADNLPRLVFADWLEEHDQPERAEVIRIQCDAAPSAKAIARCNELLEAHRAAWDEPLAPFEGEILYHRGFPFALKADFERVVKHRALLGLAPEWNLCLTRDDHDDDESQADLCAKLVASRFAKRIWGLNLAWAGWQFDEFEALLAPRFVGGLHELRFGDENHGDSILGALLRAPKLKLKTLGFGGDSYGIGDAGCRTITEAPQLAGLTGLELPNNDLTTAAAAALAHSKHLTQLRDLDLSGASNSTNTIGDEGARLLAGSANFRHLTSLNLVCNEITDDGFLALLDSQHLTALESLNLPMNELTDRSLVALAKSAGLPALNWLNVSGGLNGAITSEGVARLVRSPRMERLTGLKLGGQPIGDAGAIVLAESRHCRNLRELHVGGCGISAKAYRRMLDSPDLAGVEQFNIYDE